jgi:DNA-binding transcriptional MerR regulator
MAVVNITQAAKLAGITRQYLHSHYIKSGLITVLTGADGKPRIDTSEIIRVFGALHVDSKDTDNSLHNITPEIAPVLSHKNNDMSGELSLMRELLAEKDKRIEDLQKAFLILADKTPKKRWWWFG